MGAAHDSITGFIHPVGCTGRREGTACAKCGVRMLSVCGALEEGELAKLESLSHSTTFEPKATLFSQDDSADSVFNITDGMVRLYRLLPDGRRQIVGFAMAGDFLGLALLDHYGVSADAITHVTACRFVRRQFSAFVDEKPHLLRRLHEFASHELSLAQDQMVLLGRRSAEERVAAFILQMRDRRRRLGHTSVTLPLPMSRQDMADYLGLTIETVSRTLTKLAKDKLILVVPDGLRLLEPATLEALVTG